jgi:hypothetical protein
MGTDIHPAVEVRRNGIWRYHQPKELCIWYADVWDDPVALKEYNKRAKQYHDNKKSKKPFVPTKMGERKNTWDRCKYHLPDYFRDRNYRVFSVLANIRNDYGIPYIQEDRGFPTGVTTEAVAKMSDEHSQGWVSLAELKDYDYHQEYTVSGVVEASQYRKFLATGKSPTSWSAWVGGPAVTLSPQEYAALLESPIELLSMDPRVGPGYNPLKRYYITAEWPDDLYGAVQALPKQWVPYLENLVPKGGTDEDVRVVFDFDS